MAWILLRTNYTDASWSGLKKYTQIDNMDGSISLQDITTYTNKDNSFFGAIDANRMNEAINTIMSMVENGTDLYGAFQIYFEDQKTFFHTTASTTQQEFDQYVASLKAEGDGIVLTLKTDYENDIAMFKSIQEQLFTQWFQFIKDQLAGDVAGNLQNQIDANVVRIARLENMLDYDINNDPFSITLENLDDFNTSNGVYNAALKRIEA